MRADFDRVYSPPEPPRSRLRRARAALVVLAVLAVTGGAAAVVVPMVGGDDPDPGARPSASAGPETTAPTARSSAPPSTGASTGASQEPPAPSSSAPSNTGTSAAGPLTELPDVCGTVDKATFLKWVPKGTKEEFGGAGSGAGFCGYFSRAGQPFRYLRLETRIGNARSDIDPISVARWSFGQDLQAQQKDTSTRTLLVASRTGLGEEAFQRFSVNKGEPTVTARVEARVANVIVTVTYDRSYSGKPEKEQKTSLDVAASVVEEALRTYV